MTQTQPSPTVGEIRQAVNEYIRRNDDMSYSFSFQGDADAIGKTFDDERTKAAGWGMIEAEQRDIDEARDFAMQIAQEHGGEGVEFVGTCSGHWNLGDEAKFGRVTVTIERKGA